MNKNLKKLDWKKIFEAYNVMANFEEENLYDVDWSELFEGNPQEALDMFYFSGLLNRDFLTSDIPMQKGLQRKYKFNGKKFDVE